MLAASKIFATTRRSLGRHLPLAAAFALLALAAPACTGEAGPDGIQGPSGPAGNDGQDGQDGQDGPKGDPGDSPVVDPNLSPLEKAFVGIGGKASLDALTTLHVQSTGARWVEGESPTPDSPPEKASSFTLDMAVDLANDGMRLHYMRDINFLGITVQTDVSEILNGNLGFIDGNENILGFPSGDMASDRWGSIRKQQRLLNPHIILRQLAADGSLLLDDKGVALLDGSVHHLLVVDDPVAPITLWVNRTTGAVDKLTVKESDPLIRDNDVEVLYYGWASAPSGGLRFPSDVYIARDGVILHEENRVAIDVNPMLPGDAFDFPQGANPVYDADAARRGDANAQHHQIFASVGIPLDGAQTFVQETQIAPGIHHLIGGSHHSMVVEQQNGLVLIEAPLDELRSEALLGWIGTNLPGKPITHVIATHFHTDHASGVRTIAAQGAQVVVGEVSAPFFKHVLAAPSTVVPDALSMNPMAVVVHAVPTGGSFTINDATHPVTAFQIPASHSADMLIAVMPTQGVAFVSDLLNPAMPLVIPPPFLQNVAELASAMLALGLPGTTQIAGGHGAGTNTLTEVLSALP